MYVKWLIFAFGLTLLLGTSASLVVEKCLSDEARLSDFLCTLHLCSDAALYRRGYRQLWDGTPEQVRASVETLRRAVFENPASAYRWLDLADALLQNGRVKQASYCYRRAVELGPTSPPILFRAASFHLTAKEEAHGLSLMSRILEQIRSYDQPIFSFYGALGLPTEQVLQQGIPRRAGPARSYLLFTLRHNNGRGAGVIWQWLSARGFADEQTLGTHIDFLLEAKEYGKAAEVFASYAHESSGYVKGNEVFNGGFEREPLGVALGWRIRNSSNVNVERDAEISQTGRWSLRVRFNGRENVSFSDVTQQLALDPGRFRFSADLRTKEITTDQGVGFRIFCAEAPARLDTRTQTVAGSTEWRTLRASFTVSQKCRLVTLAAVREKSWKFDNKIAGTAWIDNVLITRY